MEEIERDELNNVNEKTLIEIASREKDNIIGIKAKIELDYRFYREQRRANRVIVLLTFVLAMSAILQFIKNI